jgi:hypothetical protein
MEGPARNEMVSSKQTARNDKANTQSDGSVKAKKDGCISQEIQILSDSIEDRMSEETLRHLIYLDDLERAYPHDRKDNKDDKERNLDLAGNRKDIWDTPTVMAIHHSEKGHRD